MRRHFSKPAFANLAASRGTAGSRISAALRALLKRSQTLTCEIHEKDTFHLYDGASKVADICCADLPATGKGGRVRIALDERHVVHNRALDLPDDIANLLVSRATRLADADYDALGGAEEVERHLRLLLSLARAHKHSRQPEGVVEAFLVQQARLIPDTFYPIDRQLVLSTDSRMDIVAVDQGSRLLYIELKVQGDKRSPEAFHEQLRRYAALCRSDRLHQEVVASYQTAFEQRRQILAGVDGIERIAGAIDWAKVAAQPPKLILLLNAYDPTEIECYHSSGGDFELLIYASNRMLPARAA